MSPGWLHPPAHCCRPAGARAGLYWPSLAARRPCMPMAPALPPPYLAVPKDPGLRLSPFPGSNREGEGLERSRAHRPGVRF